jgi:uncharacterized DUF497 family protein
MKFEWDEAKRRINLTRHGIDFADVAPVFGGPVIDLLDNRYDYGERRLLIMGLLRGEVVVIAYTERGNIIRLISARKASKHEEIKYFKAIWN